MHSQVPYPCPLSPMCAKFIIICALSDSDIAVRRKAAFLLNSLLIPSAPAATTRAPGTRVQGGPAQSGETVHPNSHASMVADPTSVDTAPETVRAVRAHGMLPVIVRELTEPTPYGPDGDEGDGCDVDLEEKLMRCVLWSRIPYNLDQGVDDWILQTVAYVCLSAWWDVR